MVINLLQKEDRTMNESYPNRPHGSATHPDVDPMTAQPLNQPQQPNSWPSPKQSPTLDIPVWKDPVESNLSNNYSTNSDTSSGGCFLVMVLIFLFFAAVAGSSKNIDSTENISDHEVNVKQDTLKLPNKVEDIWSYELIPNKKLNRWDVWEQFVKNPENSTTWIQFKEEVFIHNPHLNRDNPVFQIGETYLLPE